MNKEITITMEEYRELLIIKGKYEELKEQQKSIVRFNDNLFLQPNKTFKEPYKVTCNLGE